MTWKMSTPKLARVYRLEVWGMGYDLGQHPGVSGTTDGDMWQPVSTWGPTEDIPNKSELI